MILPPRYAASEIAKSELARLLQRINNCCEFMEGFQNNRIKLILYFDEAHVVAEMIGRVCMMSSGGASTSFCLHPYS
jgi:hypothetical protein